MKEPIILIGGGGHCKSCIDVIEDSNIYDIAGIIDTQDKINAKILGYSVIGNDNDIPDLLKKYNNCIVTVGQIKNYTIRKKLYNILSENMGEIVSIVSPRAYISKHSKINKGTIVMHGAKINAGASIGNNCIINTGAIIEHDVQISNHCHISTGSIVNGDVNIAEGVFVGSSAVIREGVSIGQESIIGAGAIVLHDVLPKTIVRK